MAISQEQKVDFLLKKIGFTASKTGNATDATGLSGTLTPKAGFAEAIPSPLIIANTALWNESASIPATPPGSDTTQVKVYAPAGALRMTVDSTVANNRAFIAYTTYNNTSSARLTNWIDTQFGPDYIIQVFVNDATVSSNKLNAGGSGNNDGWFFDYSAGVLNFNDTNVPTSVTSTNVYIVGYRYIGQTGAPTSGISTFSYLDLTVERNLDVGVQGGISTFRNNIDLNADIDVDGHTNLDNVSVAGVSTFTGAIDANGDLDVDGHTELDNVNVSGIITSAAATVNGETILNGNVSFYGANYGAIWRKNNNRFTINDNAELTFGNGNDTTIKHNNSHLLITNTTGNIDVTGNVLLNNDLDVDGHTNLDNISVAGVSTFTGDATFSGNVSIGGTLTYEDVTNVDSVGLLTARSGIRVTGGVIEAQAGENKIPSLYSNLGALPSAGTYHGMFAHVHSTQKGYFAHAGGWYELVNKETNGNVGTGTETYNIGSLTATAIDLNGDIDVDGHTNLDNVSIAGVSTFADDLYIAENIIHTGDTDTKISFPSNDTIKLETGSNYITHDNSKTVFKQNIRCGDYVAHRNTDSLGIKFLNGGTGNKNTRVGLGAEDNGTSTNHTTFNVYRQGSAVERVNIDNFGTLNAKQAFTVAGISTLSGNVDINADLDVDGHTNLDNISVAGVSTFAGAIDANGDLDVDGHTNLDNVNVVGTTTITQSDQTILALRVVGNTQFQGGGNSGDVTFVGAGNYNLAWDKAGNNLDFDDGVKARFGSNNRLQISSGNTLARFRLEGGVPLTISKSTTEDIAKFIPDGAVELYHNNTKRFETTSQGINVTGHSELDNVNIVGVTTHQGHVLPSADVTYDLGSSSKQWRNLYADNIVSAPGIGFIGPDLTVRNFKATGISTFTGNATFNSTITAGGATGSNGQYLKTTGTGVAWASFPTLRTRQTFTASAGQTTFSFSYNVNFVDVFVNGIKLTDAEFTATNGSSVVLAVGCFVGDIVELVSYNTISGGGGGGGSLNNIVEDTTPQLGGNLDLFNKNITGTGNINITGSVTATNFIGNGSGLTGIVASGSGVVIKNSGSTVGTAGTINFGNNLNVSPASAGIVTITAVGITTVSGVANIANDLDVDGHTNLDNVSIAGVSTFNSLLRVRETNNTAYSATASPDAFSVGNINSSANTNFTGIHLFTDGNGRGVVNLNALNNSTNSSADFTIQTRHNGTLGERFRIASNGNVSVNNDLDVSGDLDVDGHTNLDNVSIAGFTTITQDLDVDGHTELDNVNIAGVVTATTFKGAIEATSGTFSSNVTIDAGANTTLDVVADSAGVAMVRATGASNDQTTAAFELVQSTTSVQGGGISYNGDGNPAFVSGETADHTTFYRILNGTRYEVFSYPYNSNTVTFNGDLYGQRFYGPVTGNLTGTVITAAQPNITSLGTLTGLSVSGTNDVLNVTHTGGNCAKFNRGGKTVSINANYAAGNSFSDIGLTSGMDLKFSLGGSHKIVFKSAGHIEPETDSQINLGSTTKRFANVYADNFVGDGSGLTGITASGSGVVIKHDGNTVGTAGTINFGTNLDVSALSGGAVTITASGGSGSGISTISGVVNIANDLDVDGHTNLDNVSVAGVSTFAGITTVTGNTLFAKQVNVSGVSTFQSASSYQFTVGAGNLVVNGNSIYGSSKIIIMGGGGSDTQYYAGGTSYSDHIFKTLQGGSQIERFRIGASGDIGLSGENYGTSGQVLTSGGSGAAASWTTISSGTDVGITTNLSGTFTASAGSPSTINTFAYHDNDKVVEYTVYIKNGSNFQSQKVLAMRDGTTIHSTQFAVMFSSSLLVQCDATISSGNILLRATPESGVSGSTTYKVKREVM